MSHQGLAQSKPVRGYAAGSGSPYTQTNTNSQFDANTCTYSYGAPPLPPRTVEPGSSPYPNSRGTEYAQPANYARSNGYTPSQTYAGPGSNEYTPSAYYTSRQGAGRNVYAADEEDGDADALQRERERLDEEAEEAEMARKGVVDWATLGKKDFWLDKGMIKWYIITALIITVVALMTFAHKQIINWLTPAVRKFQSLKGGWAIPIAILFVLSFPPLFGNEIVLILVGLIWGLGEGFGIAAAGTILGEVANFIVFKYWCRGRAEKTERKNLTYACLSRVLRDGGLWMCWLSRLSVIPTHFTTIVYSVCGFPFWKFCLALVLGLPKQLINVYIGVVLGRSNPTTNSRVISDSVFAATAVISIIIAAYIYWKMSKIRMEVWREQKAYAKQQRLKGNGDGIFVGDAGQSPATAVKKLDSNINMV